MPGEIMLSGLHTVRKVVPLKAYRRTAIWYGDRGGTSAQAINQNSLRMGDEEIGITDRLYNGELLMLAVFAT